MVPPITQPISPARQSNQSQQFQPPFCTSLYSKDMIDVTPAAQPNRSDITPTQRRCAGRLLTNNHPNNLCNLSLIDIKMSYSH